VLVSGQIRPGTRATLIRGFRWLRLDFRWLRLANSGFHDHVEGAAREDQMLDIVAPDKKKLSPSAY
jgi:hypothetical protein